MRKTGGYIAITLTIVVSLFVMVVAISLGSSSLFTRTGITDFYSKQFSYTLARSCLNYALLQLADSASYVGNEVITVSGNNCTLLTITTVGPNFIISAEAQANNAATNLRLTVNTQTLSTVSLEELQSF